MITALELIQKISEADVNIIDYSIQIKGIISTRPKTDLEYKANNKELKRLKLLVKKARENKALYNLIMIYISSGIQMDGIKGQRNALMIKLSTIKEREKEEGINRTLVDKENKKIITAFESKYKVGKLKQQLRIMNFILK